MKNRIIFLVVLTLIFTSALSTICSDANTVEAAGDIPVFQAIGSMDGSVTATLLNVRQGPSTDYDIVSVLKKGDGITVFGKIGEWYAVYEPSKGCLGAVHSNYINIGQEEDTIASNDFYAQEIIENTVSIPPTNVSQDEQELLNLINSARMDAGVAPLKFDSKLMESARTKAGEMVNTNYFSHESPTYGSPFDLMKQMGIDFKTACENIAGNKTVEGAFKAWMKDDDHKQNILNEKFNYSGVGVVESKTYGKVLVLQNIGR